MDYEIKKHLEDLFSIEKHGFTRQTFTLEVNFGTITILDEETDYNDLQDQNDHLRWKVEILASDKTSLEEEVKELKKLLDKAGIEYE